MDLLYSGYIESKIIQHKENLTIFQPNNLNWKEKLAEISNKISKEEFLIIIDSFNGIYNIFDDLESARFVNSCIHTCVPSTKCRYWGGFHKKLRLVLSQVGTSYSP